jgi:N-acetylmuramoyl-L-alanine amidase
MFYPIRLFFCSIIFLLACNGPKKPEVKIAPPPAPVVVVPIRTKPLLILDAGHGGPDPGAINDSLNLFEKNVTRKLVDAILKKIDTNKISVILTRTKDENIDRHMRIANANAYNPDLFLSIHNNFNDDTTYNGYEINISDSTIMNINGFDTVRNSNPNKDSCIKFASVIENNLGKTFPKMNARPYKLRKDNIWVLCSPKYPSIMVEFGFISNKHDLLYLTDKKEIDKFATTVAKSIYKIFRIKT